MSKLPYENQPIPRRFFVVRILARPTAFCAERIESCKNIQKARERPFGRSLLGLPITSQSSRTAQENICRSCRPDGRSPA